ncbi:hypothetical protein LSH36_4g06017 [Paralvinella palmiformis]|uniref:Uncharacterized protein n=1 Tax=Paralvinella palmiformis TaxID=53620 RepID=A0AAD9KGI2_9ANNE|nr:hypothetical protein LSH36_4g06017 [Paralvinella palmiformis]
MYVCLLLLIYVHFSTEEMPNIENREIKTTFDLFMTNGLISTTVTEMTSASTIMSTSGSGIESDTATISTSTTDTSSTYSIDLEDLFSNGTTGFLSLDITDKSISSSSIDCDSESDCLKYEVRFNVSELSRNSALCDVNKDTCLTGQLYNVMGDIVNSDKNFQYGYSVEGNSTNDSMTDTIKKFTEENIKTVCNTLGDVCSHINNTCYVVAGKITCENKCIVYEKAINSECTSPSTSLNNIFINGTCIIKDGNPECDCGYSPGDIMPNFYGGTRCISSAFVVGIAAGLGGFIIVVLIGLAIGFGCKSSKLRNEKDVIEAYKDNSFDKPKEELLIESDVDKKSFTNMAFDNRYESLVRLEEEFPNFQPTLTHINPEADPKAAQNEPVPLGAILTKGAVRDNLPPVARALVLHEFKMASHVKMRTKIQARNNPFQSSQDIANDLIHEYVIPNMNCPTLPAIERIATTVNHHRRQTRPKHPTYVDFDLDEGQLPSSYLRDDIRVDEARHLIFATNTQLSLLQKAKTRWTGWGGGGERNDINRKGSTGKRKG